MTERRVVFVGSDFILNRVLDGIADSLSGSGIEVLRGPRATATRHPEYAPERYRELFARAEAILVTTRARVPAALLDAAPRLRGVVFPSIGVDSIDLAAATARGVVVAQGPTPEIFVSMAEATVMLILALTMGLRDKERQLAANLPRPDVPRAFMLQGRTVGLVGLGRIGRAVVERLAGWGVRLLACDPGVDDARAPAGVRMVDLPTLLRDSDVVSLHVTMGAGSARMIGEAQLRAMKPCAFLVNTSRGGVVDEPALCRALGEGWIAGAALDTFEIEPLPQDSPLRRLDNVILTNHCAGHTSDIIDAIAPTVVENVARVLDARTPLHVANPEVLPAWRQRWSAVGASVEPFADAPIASRSATR